MKQDQDWRHCTNIFDLSPSNLVHESSVDLRDNLSKNTLCWPPSLRPEACPTIPCISLVRTDARRSLPWHSQAHVHRSRAHIWMQRAPLLCQRSWLLCSYTKVVRWGFCWECCTSSSFSKHFWTKFRFSLSFCLSLSFSLSFSLSLSLSLSVCLQCACCLVGIAGPGPAKLTLRHQREAKQASETRKAFMSVISPVSDEHAVNKYRSDRNNLL